MGRIQIVNTTVGPQRPADYVLKRNVVATGANMEKYIHTGLGKMTIRGYELPSCCPLCLTEGRVVNYNVEGYHFRCLECEKKW